MSIQLPLPAGWARQFTSMPDPRNRLDALKLAYLNTRAEIRKSLTRLADEFDIPVREVDRAMDHADDTLSDLTWDVERDYTREIEDGHPL